jgi:hypothetical protein
MGAVMQQLVLMNQNMRALVGRMEVMEEELGKKKINVLLEICT